jgi:phage terminase large subunit-like protein
LTRGERNCAWIEAYCKVPEGKGVGGPLVLRPFQRKDILTIYDSPTRRAIISRGRKNAKTTFSALLTLLHLAGPEARPNSRLYSTALSRDQAALLFEYAAKMVRLSPDLNPVVAIRDTAKELVCPELGTKYKALSAESKTAFGLSPVFIVHDELGQVVGPRSQLYEALETATGAQEEPLSIIISTQAPTDGDLLSILIDDAKTGADPKVKLIFDAAPLELDPFSDEAIRAANPAFGDFLNETEVREQAESARRMPAREAAYRNLVLNQRVNAYSPFIARATWDACGGAVSDDVFANHPVYAGLDLSGRNDLTALVLVARDDAAVWHVKSLFWTPEVGLADRAHRDRVPYDKWAKDGHLLLTPGASVDFSFVAQRLMELQGEMDLRAIAYDRYRMDYLLAEMKAIGLEHTVMQKLDGTELPQGLVMVKHGQGFYDMPPALDGVEAELLNKRIRHGSHPVLNWNAANAVAEKNAAGERKLEKSKSTGRIDGIVALCMAMRVGLTYSIGEEYVSGGLVAL